MRALKFRVAVKKNGRLEIPRLPLTEGANVEVIILEQQIDPDDLLVAAQTGLTFWDNPIDDEVWNDA